MTGETRHDGSGDGEGPVAGDDSGDDAGPAATEDPAACAADGPDHEAAIRELCRRADAVRARELESALAKLEARGDVTPAQRAALERLSRRLTGELVGAPVAQLRAAAAAGEDEAVRAALGLFGAAED